MAADFLFTFSYLTGMFIQSNLQTMSITSDLSVTFIYIALTMQIATLTCFLFINVIEATIGNMLTP